MNIKSLKTLAFVALFGAVSTSASAAVKADEVIVKGGFVYKVKTAAVPATKTEPAKNATATFVGIAAANKSVKTALTIPASISYTDEGAGTTETIDITAIDGKWADEQKTGEYVAPKSTQALPETVVSLTIQAPVDALPEIPTVTKGKLTTLDIKGTKITTISATTFKVADYAELTNVTLPDGLKIIDGAVFKGFKGTSITLPETLEEIGTEAFEGAALTSIAIPAKVQIIKNFAFNKNADLATLDLSKAAALKSIGTNAFTNTKLGKTSFKGCEALEEIKESAFDGIKTFNAVLGSATALKIIGKAAFRGTATENANIPTVENIGENAFYGCEALKAVAMTAAKSIGNNAFNGCKLLAKVTIPAGVTVINDGMFWNCEALANVTFNCANATKLGTLAFANTALTSVDLSGTKVTELKADVFKGCTALETITLPKTVTTIAANVFADAIISELDLSETGVTELTNNMFGYWDEKAYKANDKDHPNTTLKTLKLGNVTIPASMFAYFTALETVEMGKGPVNESAFANCTSLTSFKKGDGYISGKAFENDTKLETVVMGDGIVDSNAFYMCAALKTFDYATDAASITGSIKGDAFIGCTYPVIINTINSYVEANPTAPTNAKYGTGAILTVKTVKDNGGSGKSFMYFHNDNKNVAMFEKAEGTNFYSIYVDEGTAYFQSVRANDGKIYVMANENIIIKTDEEKEVEYTLTKSDKLPKGAKKAVLVDEVICLTADKKLVDFQAAPGVKYSDGKTDVTFEAGQYIYRLTNKAPMGFGFTYYAGETMKAGQFFILSTTAPDASARLNTVWLDEDGNVESDATAIETVKQAVNDGVVYNMAGQQVDGNYKGIVIKNGKKMIQK